MIDGQKLSDVELQAVRDGPIPTNPSSNTSRSEHVSIDMTTESSKFINIFKLGAFFHYIVFFPSFLTLINFSDKALESSVVSVSEIERSTRKSRKVREVVIEDFDTLDELRDKDFPTSQMTGSIGKYLFRHNLALCVLLD